jgi:hypothetical protein
MRWTVHVARTGDRKGSYGVLVGKPEEKRPLVRPRHRWEDNIKMDLLEVGWGMDWIDLGQHSDSWRALVIAYDNEVYLLTPLIAPDKVCLYTPLSSE